MVQLVAGDFCLLCDDQISIEAMKLNVNNALKAEAERKAKPVPIPVIRRKSPLTAASSSAGLTKETIVINANDIEYGYRLEAIQENVLITQLESERHSIMLERKKLSTRTASLVDEVYRQIKGKEGAAAADEFMKGNISSTQLRDHYSKIQGFTDSLVSIYDHIEYVKQNGKLPDADPVVSLIKEESQDVAAITWEIRRLDDLIYKLNKKLVNANSGIKKPKNSDRTNTWRTTMAMAEAKRDDLKLKRKQLRNGRG
jgi:hypothetical protein